jgi:hypothetical protein
MGIPEKNHTLVASQAGCGSCGEPHNQMTYLNNVFVAQVVFFCLYVLEDYRIK